MTMQSADCHMPFTVFGVIINQTINQLTNQPTKCTNPLIHRSIDGAISIGRSGNTLVLLLEK